MKIVFWIVALFCVPFVSQTSGTRSKREAKPYKMVCYWNTGSVSRRGDGKFLAGNIDPTLCTHMVMRSAGLGDDGFLHFNSEFPPKDLGDVFDLKKKNPDLKILLSLDDLSEPGRNYLGYPDFHTFQDQLLKGVDKVLESYKFDGFDLDLSKPDIHGASPNINQDILDLLGALRSKMDHYGLLLTALVSADKTMMDKAYDIPHIDHLVDFVNLMAFDYHGGAEKFTGLNAPMYPGTKDTGYAAYLNVDWSVKHWLESGASAEKVVLGVPSYGQTFTLSNPEEFGVGAPVAGYGKAGPYLQKAGIQAYNELCDSVANHGWYVNWDDKQEAPYAHMDNQWVGYDDDGSIKIKGQYAAKKGLGGAMLWTIDMDDFRASCGTKAFPLLNEIHHAMEEYGGPKPGPAPGPEPHPAPGPYGNGCYEAGQFPNQQYCTKYYQCIQQGKQLTRFDFECGPGTAYNPKVSVCDWPYNVPGCN